MVELLPSARPGVGGEVRQVAAVCLDGMWRGIALAQVAKEIGNGFADDGFGLLVRSHKNQNLRMSHLAFALG